MKKVLFILAFLFTGFVLKAQTVIDPEQLLKGQAGVPKLVTDYTGTLSPSQIQALESKLVNLDNTTSTQVAVVIIPTLNGRDIAEYNNDLLRAWGVGNKKYNNGVLLLVAKNDRKLNITTGYGLEGSLPDITASQIIQDVIVPQFKANDYYGGIDAGTDAIIQAVQGTYNDPREYSGGEISFFKMLIIFLVVMFILWMLTRGNKGNGTFVSRRGSRGVDGPIFWPTGGGGWGGGYSGGGGGDWGGGGFGGFGGGSSGGGGASGSW